jgi:hypothetical protein
LNVCRSKAYKWLKIYRTDGQRHSVNLISSLTNQGKVRFMLYEDNFNSAAFIKFLEQLTHDIERKIFMILDNLWVHHSRTVQEWFLEHQ